MVNAAMHPSEWIFHYFVDPAEQNAPLIEQIQSGYFIMLYGARASGKSTRVQKVIQQLKHEFIGIQ